MIGGKDDRLVKRLFFIISCTFSDQTEREPELWRKWRTVQRYSSILQATSYGGSIILNAAASVKKCDKIVATVW